MERRPHLEHGGAAVEESPRVAIGAPAVALAAQEIKWPVLRGGAAGALRGGVATGAALVSVVALFDAIALVAAIAVLFSILLRFAPSTSRTACQARRRSPIGRCT